MGELKSKLKHMWKGFFSDTSIHGLRYFVLNRHNVATKIFWILCVSTSISFLIYNLHDTFITYIAFEYDTKTAISFEPKSEMPAISFCNSHSFDNKKINESHYLWRYLERKFNRPRHKLKGDKWNDTVNLGDLEAVTFSDSETILIAFLNERSSEIKPNLQTVYRRHLEKCFTMNGHWYKNGSGLPLVMSVNDEYTLYINIQQNRYAFSNHVAAMNVYIHPAHEPLDQHTTRAMLSPGNHYDIKLSIKKYSYLSAPYKSYQNLDCKQEWDLKNMYSLKYFSRYTYKGCLIECFTEMVLEKCGCRTELTIQNITDSPFCTVLQRENCVLPLTSEFYGDTTSENNITNSCSCPRPCVETKYITEVSAGLFPALGFVDVLIDRNLTENLEDARNNLMKIDFSFKDSMIEKISHRPKMSLLDSLSIIGGFMGFFLGASVLSLTEFVETLFWSTVTFISSIISKQSRPSKTKVQNFG